jgi:hypothetical protein
VLESNNLLSLADGSNKVLQTQPNEQREQGIADLIDDAPVIPNLPNPYLAKPGRPRGSEAKPKPYDGSSALPHAGHEEVGRFLATPKARREHSSLKKLATKKLNVSVSTIYLWASRADVLKRASWLTEHCRATGDLVARREWEAILEAQVKAALNGDTSAAKFCERRAWPEDGKGTAEVSNLSLTELIARDGLIEPALPTWLTRQLSSEPDLEEVQDPPDDE